MEGTPGAGNRCFACPASSVPDWDPFIKNDPECRSRIVFAEIGMSDHSCAIASAGQPATQAPQSMQVSGSTLAAPSFMAIAPTGQVPTHASHPTHFDASTFAAIIHSSFFTRGNPHPIKYTVNRESSSREPEIFRFFFNFSHPHKCDLRLCSGACGVSQRCS